MSLDWFPTGFLILLLVAALSAAGILFPEFAARHFVEDAAIETASALVFLVAAVLGLIFLVRIRRPIPWLIGLSAFSLLAALDELSFGQRLFGWQAPVLKGVSIDAAHDALQLSRVIILSRTDAPYLVVGIALLAAAAAGLAVLATRPGLRRSLEVPELPYILGMLAALALAQAIDIHLDILQHHLIQESYLEEHLELAAGLCAVAAVVVSGRRQDPKPG